MLLFRNEYRFLAKLLNILSIEFYQQSCPPQYSTTYFFFFSIFDHWWAQGEFTWICNFSDVTLYSYD